MAALKLTPPSKTPGFVDVCCKNVTRSAVARLDMYQLVSTINTNSTRARAEAFLSNAVAA